jgi:CBS domain-containing protein
MYAGANASQADRACSHSCAVADGVKRVIAHIAHSSAIRLRRTVASLRQHRCDDINIVDEGGNLQRKEAAMQMVSEVMTRDVRFVSPQESLQRAAQMMEELNVGALPVCDGERLVGMVTDRDITIRATAAGRAPQETHVDEVMSTDVRWCFEDQPLDDVMNQMAGSQVRRVPVVSHDASHRLVGIVALGDLVIKAGKGARQHEVEGVVEQVSSPAQPDRPQQRTAMHDQDGGANTAAGAAAGGGTGVDAARGGTGPGPLGGKIISALGDVGVAGDVDSSRSVGAAGAASGSADASSSDHAASRAATAAGAVNPVAPRPAHPAHHATGGAGASGDTGLENANVTGLAGTAVAVGAAGGTDAAAGNRVANTGGSAGNLADKAHSGMHDNTGGTNDANGAADTDGATQP